MEVLLHVRETYWSIPIVLGNEIKVIVFTQLGFYWTLLLSPSHSRNLLGFYKRKTLSMVLTVPTIGYMNVLKGKSGH